MHSAREQKEWESIEGMDDSELRQEVIDLRREVKDLQNELYAERTSNKATGGTKGSDT
jgi:hypothetical protein